jgi:hypothetical protein
VREYVSGEEVASHGWEKGPETLAEMEENCVRRRVRVSE